MASRHIQHIGDGIAVKQYFEGFPIETLSTATGAWCIGIGHKLHVEFDHPVALASLAAASPNIEGKPTGLVTPDFGQRHHGKQRAEQIKQTNKSSRV